VNLYWRRLRDKKGSTMVDTMSAFAFESYAGMCGWTLAGANARSGDPVAIAAYLGSTDEFDNSMTDFRYADQNESEYQTFVNAVRVGRIPVVEVI
jgi:sugar/nucleoside kinase (ribokinase family)